MIVSSDTKGVPTQELDICADAEVAELMFEDSSPLDFGTLPVGVSATSVRTLHNKSELQISYRIHTIVQGLTIKPVSGSLRPGMSATLHFQFRPMEARKYDGTIHFDSDCSNKLLLKFIGGRGTPVYKSTLDKKSRLWPLHDGSSLSYPIYNIKPRKCIANY